MLVFYFMEWVKVYYNGLETNVEVTKCGRVRKVPKYWYGKGNGSYLIKYGEVDFSTLKLHPNGYRLIKIQIQGVESKTLFLHQLVAAAFLDYKWQKHKLVVDHIDSNKLNNNLNNLIVVTQRENVCKELSNKNNLPRGVYFDKHAKKYKSQIYFNKKRIHLGYFNTIEKASNAYKNKLKEIKL